MALSLSLSLSLSNVISIQPVERLQEVGGFLRDARVQMFGARVSAQDTPADLLHFEQVYRAGAGRMWAARDAQRGVVGSIANRPYDGRFAQLDFGPQSVVEVVRLFVAPAWRRQGLAQALWATLQAHARAQGVQLLYLHTHPFLPGALEFWERHGFAVLQRETEPVWQTIHMQCVLPPALPTHVST